MSNSFTLIDVAIKFHEALPKRIREYLNSCGISDEVVDAYLLGWNGWRITIPVYDREGSVAFFRLAKDPDDPRSSSRIISSPAATVELYGWERLLEPASRIVVCQDELDRLALEAQGFPAVTSTGGPACFRKEWANKLQAVEEVYVCIHRNQSGKTGAALLGMMLPRARFVELPDEVGEDGGVTDFFGRLGRTKSEFEKLLQEATTTPPPSIGSESELPNGKVASSGLSSRIERIKRELPIEKFVGRYVELRPTALGTALRGQCPLHADRFESLAVFPRTGMYHCYQCRTRGDVIAFLAAKEHISFSEAVERLYQIITKNGELTGANDRQDKAA